MARIRNIGLPVNDSERKAISYLSRSLPDDYVLLTNLELPSPNGFPYEFDIIVIGDRAVFVVELKGYGGVIRGNALEWELSSGSIIKSPMSLLAKKAKIVGSLVRRGAPSLSRVWVWHLLVLTADRVSIHIQDPQAAQILKLEECVQAMTNPSGRPEMITRSMSAKIEEAIAGQFMPLKRDKEIGDYRLLEQVNSNELYTMFIAEHKLLGSQRRYMLKIYTLKIYDDMNEQKQHQARVLREANVLFELPPHPNLVRANPPFPSGDDRIVLPLEWVDGHSLKGLLDDPELTRTVPVRKVLLELCSVLAFVHAHGVVHRDLRPDNVIVCPDGSLKLVNFDCAHLGGQDMRTIATRLGRPLDEHYVAPEVYLDPARASKSSDIYSLGIILHELLAGSVPYQKIIDIFKTKKVESSIGRLHPGIDREADRLFLEMCAFDSRSRVSDLSEVCDRIGRLLSMPGLP
jgi:tRNA A-37 threonylcarbamoyl transferase component Bud32